MRAPRRPVLLALASLVSVVPLVGCGAHEAAPVAPPVAAPPDPPPVATAAPDPIVPLDEGPKACPAGMQIVDATYCPKPVLRCLKSEYNKPNHITICHKFAPGQTCPGGARRQRFCIDRYEYPNEEGAHPPVMVSWYDADAACSARGKRL
jgi:sulfatase modifying factor 1